MNIELQQHYQSMIRTLLYELPFIFNIQYYFNNILQFIKTKSKNIKQLLINHIQTAQLFYIITSMYM
jgi:hypothetical protein